MREDLRQLQLEELEMLKQISDCLMKNDIDFYLIGGSCIGALRHQGFIPWDDDIDIAVFRRDFNNAEQVLRTLKGDIFYDPAEHKKFPDAPIGHVYVKGLTPDASPRIDVFAIDNVPDSSFARHYQNFCAKIYHLCVLRKASKNRGRLNRLITAAICRFCPVFILDIFQKMSYKGLIRWTYKKCKCVSNIFGVRGEREVVPADFYGNARFVPFEDMYVPIPEKAEEYMTHIYGNYMELPLEDERVPGHISV